MTLTPSYLGAVVTADGGQQVDKLRIATKAGEVVAEGYAPLEFSVPNHDKAYAKGEYKVAWFNHLGVSDYVDLPAFKTVGHVESIALTPTTLSAWFGKMTPLQLTVKTTPIDAHNKDVVYSTSPVNAGLSVQSDGKVYVSDKLPIGEYKITATSVDGGKTAVSTLTISDPIVTWAVDFKDKEIGNIIINPNIFRRSNGGASGATTIQLPSQLTIEAEAVFLDGIRSLDGNFALLSNTNNGAIPQFMMQFNVVREIERKFGTAIWQGRTSQADKVNIAKQILSKLTNNNHVKGVSPAGSKVTVARFNNTTGAWVTGDSNSTANVALLTSTVSTQSQIETSIDAIGMSNFLLYSDASNGTVASSVSLDHTALVIAVDVSRVVVLPTSTTLRIG